MSQITILSLYLLAAVAFTTSRLPRFESRARPLYIVALLLGATGAVMHGQAIFGLILPRYGFDLTMGNAVALIGFELAVIGLIAALEPTLRGISGGLILLAAFTVMLMGPSGDTLDSASLSWQVRAHVLIALLSYGLLTVGAIVALFALVQERRLQAARISPVNHLFAPLETTERLLFGVAGAGFAGLTLAIASGSLFVNDLLEQHLAHKFGLSLLAWLVFSILLAGRFFRGWRGKRAVRLYLGGFALLCLAYFGSRFILEEIFQRSWG
ncbi:MAG: cytochrome c biogenesis protein CcsA [Gammaproteobacteria bacterium]|nr:cytochrome c biogenesis protein CcsA [Gammaproteobacteria bacterium]MBT8105355.1 cytochrome c biogenesis protein CcsA [Gammaproteobacteria bacterium]NNF48555.1 cytochrome c biogenesis protein CcsA [Woeseiaceae bacterium]NNK25369.1 cytochrome c biogenesis protein CcsA [Woeseiaceae bacterium]NNL63766.1 cytochrome c biogenesis protein CcsA [Woeseiaceae bacterium]